METALKDIKYAIVLLSSASERLAKYEASLDESSGIDKQGLEDIIDLVQSAKGDLEDALDEVPYVTGEK